MRAGRASRTAEQNALFRALETARPRGERVVDDPLSGAFLGWQYKTVLLMARAGFGTRIRRYIDRRWPGVRPTLVARTKVIDGMFDTVDPALAQTVILGAGFDTRSWRLDRARRSRATFEVDHPDTQQRKRSILKRRGVDTTAVRFVPTDFHLGRLNAAMVDQGFEPAERTLFLWEGTTNYLDAESVDATLRWIARSAPGSELIFTYVHADLFTHPERYAGSEQLFASLERADEPMTFGLDPSGLSAYLADRGVRLRSDVSAAEYRAQVYGAEAAGMQGHEFYRVAHAEIDGA